MKQIILTVILIFTLGVAFADKVDPNSPILWSGDISTNGQKVEYSNSDFQTLLDKGFENEKLKLKCEVALEKGFLPKSKDGKFGGNYYEKVGVTCDLDGVTIKLHSVLCQVKKRNELDVGLIANNFIKGNSSTKIGILCSTK